MPEAVEVGPRDRVARGEPTRPDLAFTIEAGDRMGPEEHLDVHPSSDFSRLLDQLAKDHPRTRTRLRTTNFHRLVSDFLLAQPPSKASLHKAGAALPDFVASHPLAERFAALADVARLERTRVEIFDAREAAALSRERFMEATGEDPEGFELRLVPATRVLELEAHALGFWQDPEGDWSGAPANHIDVFVFRKGPDVLHRPCVEDEARCLEELARKGITLPDLAERLLKHDAGAEDTSERFAALLELWLENEVLIDPHPHPAA
ncbi:MAG: 3-deoxy-7-phosphoheptulonate synthase [bacterium]|nr:3-deoxy-7-phosphoheptulonate synthase [bacterium]